MNKTKAEINFPIRKIKILNADIEVDIVVPDADFDQLLDIFNRREMNPLIRLMVHSVSGEKAEFTNLHLENIEGSVLGSMG